MLLAALATGKSTITNLSTSDDTQEMINALQQIGIHIEKNNQTAKVFGIGQLPQTAQKNLTLGNAGTVARFITSLCAVSPGKFELNTKPQMQKRPMAALYNSLRNIGVIITVQNDASFPCEVGSFTPKLNNTLLIDDDSSSQFISSLLMIAPYLPGETHIIAQNPIRRGYIDMTLALMKSFGVSVIEEKPYHWKISQQSYQAQHIVIEPDLASANYLFAATALTGRKLTLNNISQNSIQPDIQFLNLLAQMGCTVSYNQNSITLQAPQQLNGLFADMKNFSDNFMTLACIAPFAKSETVITGLKHTQHQESQRISNIAAELRKANVSIEHTDDSLTIHPSNPQATILDSHHDHRIAMSLTLLRLKSPDIVIHNTNVVSKSFPDFFKTFKDLFA